MEFLFLPVLGAFIGWSTNMLAIRMLFRPRRPWRVPVLGLTVQGLLPRRRQELARAIGEVVGERLLAPEFLGERLAAPRVRAEVAAHVTASVRRRVDTALPAALPRPLVGVVADVLAEVARREIDSFLTTALPKVLETARGEVDLAGAVEDRLNRLSLEELEEIMVRLARREIRHIEVLGGAIGFLVGLVQAAIAFLL